MNFADQIRLQCARNGDRPALSFGRLGANIISYATLGQYIGNVSARLARLGVVPGAVYGILHPTWLVHVVLILALERLGAATVTLKTAHQKHGLKLAGILADAGLPPIEGSVARVNNDWLLSSAGGAPPATRNRPLDDVCRIAFTSGSTGRPKAVALTYAKVAAGNALQRHSMGEDYGRLTNLLCYVGIDVAYGYRRLLRTLSDGGMFGFPDPDFTRGIKGTGDCNFQTVIGSPIQLSLLADFCEAHPGSFPSLKMVVCGGARLSSALAERLQRVVCPCVFTTYGSSEAGYVAAGLVETLDLERGEVGRVIPGVDVQIVDEITRQPVTGGTGLLRMRGTDIIRSYYGEDPAQDEHFEGEWFYPGDVGSFRLRASSRSPGAKTMSSVSAA
jgi:long-subunit acyl-CoA synthetase (AMP-forming)